MSENRERRRRNPRGKGRMRALNRPPRGDRGQDSSSSHGHRTPREHGGRHEGGRSRPGKDHGGDGVTRRRIRDDRLFGALCHAGVFLGIWGLVTTGAIWALRKDRSRVLRFQGAQALVYQVLVQGLLLAGAVFCVLWMRAEGTPLSGVPDFFAGLNLDAPNVLTGLTALQALCGFVATLVMLLCLFGLEPSYPLVGLLTRRLLGLRTRAAPEPKEGEKTHYVNAGIYLFDRSVLERMPAKGSLDRELIPAITKKGELTGFVFSGKWKHLM